MISIYHENRGHPKPGHTSIHVFHYVRRTQVYMHIKIRHHLNNMHTSRNNINMLFPIKTHAYKYV